jgi:GT2 family glycosyltransferase
MCAKDKVGYTFNCLQSIKTSCKEWEGRYEVCLVSDGSSQETNSFLSGVHGLRLLLQRENAGFVRSNNFGVRAARGDYIVLINNDTIVAKDFLNYLMRTFREHHNVGIVGSKLLYPSGRLQEAGGIVWSNGAAWNFGRFDDPNKSEYRYVRDVDYCSGAALSLHRKLIRRRGVFDERFHPGYYEDTDLCFFARSIGTRVLYQPRAVVIHFEGASHGRTLSTGIKRYQSINRTKFVAKWKTALRLQYEQDPRNDLRASDRLGQKSVLLFDLHVPQFDTNSGDLRTYWIMRLLRSLNWHVTLFPVVRAKVEPYASALEQYGIEVARNLLPENILQKRKSHFDAIVLSKLRVALRLIDTVCALSPWSIITIDFPDLESVREERYARLTGDRKRVTKATELFQKEIELSKKADLVLTITNVERNHLLESDLQTPVMVIPNIHEPVKARLPFRKRRDILFVGAFRHPPNLDAVRFLVDQIFPLIRERLRDAQLIIAGSDMPQLVRNTSAARVRTLGYVEDLSPLLNSCRVFVAPLRYGAGLKGKVGMAMAAGLPVVATPIGAEGINTNEGRLMLVAEDVKEFADHVTKLYSNEKLWQAVSRHERRYAEENYSPTAVRRLLRDALEHARPLNLEKRLARAPKQSYYARVLAVLERSLMGNSRDAAHSYVHTVMLRTVQILSTYGWHYFITRALQKARLKDFQVN